MARRKWPGDPATRRLEDLVTRARSHVYASKSRAGGLVEFVTSGYWRLIAETPSFLLVSTVLLLGSGLIGCLWAMSDPPAALNFVPDAYRVITEPREAGADLGVSGAEQAALSSFIFTNNIRVSFLAFAAGMTGGLGTGLLLLYNGALFGVLTGLAISSGNGVPFTELVVPHGVLELSCIIFAAAAGLRLGWALVSPGRRTRREAVIGEARPAVEIILGTIPWLVLAGLVEGFLTPAGLGLPIALTIGIGLGLVYWALVIGRGRDQSRARDLARR